MQTAYVRRKRFAENRQRSDRGLSAGGEIRTGRPSRRVPRPKQYGFVGSEQPPRQYLSSPSVLGLPDLGKRIPNPDTNGWYSASQLSRLERGWANAPLYVYLRIAEALEVDEWRLFARDEVGEEVSAAEMVLVRFLRETNTPAERALARLVGGSLSP